MDGGTARVDVTYIDTAAHVHPLALEQLLEREAAPCAGKAYFVSQESPSRWAPSSTALAAALPPVTRSVSAKVAWGAGYAMEALTQRRDEPR